MSTRSITDLRYTVAISRSASRHAITNSDLPRSSSPILTTRWVESCVRVVSQTTPDAVR